MNWDEINKSRPLPGECLTVKDAFNAIGKRVLNRDDVAEHLQWTGKEAELRDLGPRPTHPRHVFIGSSFEKLDPNLYRREAPHVAKILRLEPRYSPFLLGFDDWCKAIDIWEDWSTHSARLKSRRDNTLLLMQRLAACNKLKFSMLDLKTGDVRSVKPRFWNCSIEHASDRLIHASLNSDPRWYMTRPAASDEFGQYLKRFDIPLFVDGKCIPALRSYLDRATTIALKTSADSSPFDLLDVVVEGVSAPDLSQKEPEEKARPRPGSTGAVREASASADEIYLTWAKDAAARGVSIRNAKKDAFEEIGKAAPNEALCRSLLKDALAAIGIDVKRGRPNGAKSHWNKEK